ncbi:MAG: hypothetical protein M0P16_07735 [Syntrophales bacterium]|nr:hypothetical protein [Syntrophales bacterium]
MMFTTNKGTTHQRVIASIITPGCRNRTSTIPYTPIKVSRRAVSMFDITSGKMSTAVTSAFVPSSPRITTKPVAGLA